MNLTEAVTTAVTDAGGVDQPAAVLALAYAARIDEATHISLPMAKALHEVRNACHVSQVDGAVDALAKVTAELSAVTVLADLGPKLLAALDALTLTPKAYAAIRDKLGNQPPTSPLDKLRDRHGNRHLRAAE